MNKLHVETNGTSTYLVYEVLPEEEIDTLSLGMVVNNKISHVMPIIFTQIDSNKLLKYNISSKKSLKQFFSGVVSKKRLLTVFSSILKAITQATEYMIDASSFLLDQDYIFVDVNTCDAYLLCMPLMELADKPIDLLSFFKNIVFSVQFDQSENTDYIVKLISYLNSTESISVDDFSKLIHDLLYGKTQQKPKIQEPTPVKPKERKAEVQVQQKPESSNTVVNPSKEEPVENKEQQKPANPLQSFKIPGNFAIPGMKTQKTEKEKEKEKNKEKKCFSFFGKKKDKNEAIDKDKILNIPTKGNNSEKQGNRKSSFAIPGKNNQSASLSGSVQSIKATKDEKKPESVQSQPSTENQPQLNFGETTVLGGGDLGATTVLSTEPPKAYLIRRKNNEKITINKDVFKIGVEMASVDYCISDNGAISRNHANVIINGGEYFIVDTKSTNHTYVNGKILSPESENKIKDGDIVRLANEEFVFRIE